MSGRHADNTSTAEPDAERGGGTRTRVGTVRRLSRPARPNDGQLPGVGYISGPRSAELFIGTRHLSPRSAGGGGATGGGGGGDRWSAISAVPAASGQQYQQLRSAVWWP